MRGHARLRVGGVEGVVFGDVEPADPAEVFGLGQELPVLIEDLQPHVAAVGDEQAAARIEREAVRRLELAGRGPELAPRLDELAVLRDLRDARDGVGRGVRVLAAVSLRDEDVAVRGDDDVVRLGERVGRIAGHARLADRHQDLALRAELDHLMPDQLRGRGRRRRRRRSGSGAARGTRTVVVRVGHPDVAVAIDVDAVRERDHAGAEALHELAGRVELQHGIERRHRAGRRIGAAVHAAALAHPDRSAVLVDLDGARRSPRAARGQLEVVRDGLVRIREIVGRLRYHDAGDDPEHDRKQRCM